MVKQKLEGILSKSFKKRSDLWYIKLQVNQLAHTKSPADFIVLSEKYRYLIECKQIDLRKIKNNRFAFDRLTQENDLDLFDYKYINNKSFILFLFLKTRLNVSFIFLVPIKDFLRIKNCYINKKSMNLKDFIKYFNEYKIEVLKGSYLDLDMFIN